MKSDVQRDNSTGDLIVRTIIEPVDMCALEKTVAKAMIEAAEKAAKDFADQMVTQQLDVMLKSRQ